MRKLGYTPCEQLESEMVSGGAKIKKIVMSFSLDSGIRSIPIVGRHEDDVSQVWNHDAILQAKKSFWKREKSAQTKCVVSALPPRKTQMWDLFVGALRRCGRRRHEQR